MTSNNDGWGIRITQPVYMFIVLMAGIVGLLVISTSLTRTEVVRPHPTEIPIDPFANVIYKTYVSPDGTFQVDYPEAWTPQANPTTQLVTEFVPGGSDMQTGMQIYFTALRALQNLPPDTSPESLVRQSLSQGGVTPVITPVESNGLKGSCGTSEVDLRDGTTGKLEICVLALDSDHLVVLNGIAHADQWSRMEPVMERLKSSLQIKVESVIAQIGLILGAQATETPVPTAEATTDATSVATTEATATQVATTEAATSEPTIAATLEVTVEATSEATQAATAEATPVQ